MFEETPQERHSFDLLFKKCLVSPNTPKIDLKKFKNCFLPSGLDKSRLKFLYSAALSIYSNKGMDRNCFGVFCKFVILEMYGMEATSRNLSQDLEVPSFMIDDISNPKQDISDKMTQDRVPQPTIAHNGNKTPVNLMNREQQSLNGNRSKTDHNISNSQDKDLDGVNQNKSLAWDDKYAISFDDMQNYVKYTLQELEKNENDLLDLLVLPLKFAKQFFEKFDEEPKFLKEMWSFLDHRNQGIIDFKFIICGIHIIVLRKKFGIFIPHIFQNRNSDPKFKLYLMDFFKKCSQSKTILEVLQNLFPEKIESQKRNVSEPKPTQSPPKSQQPVQDQPSPSLARKDSTLDEPRCMPREEIQCQNFAELHNPPANPVHDLNILGKLYSGNNALFFQNILGYLKTNLRFTKQKQKTFFTDCETLDEENRLLLEKFEQKKHELNKAEERNQALIEDLSKVLGQVENIQKLISNLQLESPGVVNQNFSPSQELNETAEQSFTAFKKKSENYFEGLDNQRQINTEEISETLQKNIQKLETTLPQILVNEEEFINQEKQEKDPFGFNDYGEDENLEFNDPFAEANLGENEGFGYQKMSDSENNFDDPFNNIDGADKENGCVENKIDSKSKIQKEADDLFGGVGSDENGENKGYMF